MESASFCPAKGRFAAGGEDMWVHLYDYATGEELECNKGAGSGAHLLRPAALPPQLVLSHPYSGEGLDASDEQQDWKAMVSSTTACQRMRDLVTAAWTCHANLTLHLSGASELRRSVQSARWQVPPRQATTGPCTRCALRRTARRTRPAPRTAPSACGAPTGRPPRAAPPTGPPTAHDYGAAMGGHTMTVSTRASCGACGALPGCGRAWRCAAYGMRQQALAACGGLMRRTRRRFAPAL